MSNLDMAGPTDETEARENHHIEMTTPSSVAHNDVAGTTSTTPARTAVQRFFYPTKADVTAVPNGSTTTPNRNQSTVPTNLDERPDPLSPPPQRNENAFGDMNDPDVKFVHGFWTTFDDILILSIFTQLGIVFRLASSTWFAYFDDVFSTDSALFVNLPLNCLSCFLMGLLCSGERLMEIILTRFTPPLQRHDRYTQPRVRRETRVMDDIETSDDGVLRDETLDSPAPNGFGLRRRRQRLTAHDRNVAMARFIRHNEELRDVQLLALERRIRMSKCLVLFPVRKEDVDVMEHYFDGGYKRKPDRSDEEEEEEGEDMGDEMEPANSSPQRSQQSPRRPSRKPLLGNSSGSLDLDDIELDAAQTNSPQALKTPPRNRDTIRVLSNPAPTPRPPPPLEAPPPPPPPEQSNPNGQKEGSESEFNADFIAEFTNNVQENVQENIERLRRVNLADGWDSGTTPEAMSDDLLLGLRDGFCGALSSFSSWNSSMIRLMRHGKFGHAFVGYTLGVQLPIIAYRCGQHVAVYIFVWRTRRETRIDERRGGYGIRVNVDEESDRLDDPDDVDEKKNENEMPSLRAVITAFFIMALVTQCTSINFFSDPNDQQIALSLLFSPLGVFARWRIAKLNNWRPTFPLGTFTCNILACALSGSLGSLLAGNPGPRERIVLVSIVAGFGGTLSSVAAFVVEVLAGVDPILFRFDGVVYALASIGCAILVGFVFSASAEWADQTSSSTNLIVKDDFADNETRWY